MTRARSGKAPTIGEIAALVGVSSATVSRAFTRPEVLRPETVRRVKEAAKGLGYVPNQAARALSTGRHGNIAVVVPDVGNPFFPPLIRAAQTSADEAGFCVLLGDSDETPDREDLLVGKLGMQVAGLVLASSRLPVERIRAHAARRPLVLVNREVPGVPRVLIDSTPGIDEAMAHLVGLGHRRVAYVAGPPSSWSDQQRRRAVRRAGAAHGASVVVVRARRPTYESGEAVTPAVIESQATAAIAFDDQIAHGLLAGLAGRGIAVPSQFSVVGCDDVLASMTYPPLTTISTRSADAGRAAVELLLAELDEEREPSDVARMIGTHLVVRSTTARAS